MGTSYEHWVMKERENWAIHQVFILCIIYLIGVNLSPHLVGMVRMRESLVGHFVSLLVSMVLYLYICDYWNNRVQIF